VNRVSPHDGIVVTDPLVLLVYVGDAGVDMAPSQDSFVEWVLASPDYWAILQQYGVGYGTRVGRARALRSDIVPASLVGPTGLISASDLALQIRGWIDGADAGMSANAYVFFLPDGVDVALSVRGNYTYRTCVDAFGYHAYDGREPYAVMPACPKGRGTPSLSHELAELATNPESTRGWYSDEDARKGDEIGDLCSGTPTVDGWTVSQLWSNALGQCAP
jgi:hypothetical protein